MALSSKAKLRSLSSVSCFSLPMLRRGGVPAAPSGDPKEFRYKDLASATNNFSELNQIGRGGYGPVFKGRMKVGKEVRAVAVKKLSPGSVQGDKQFKSEVLLLSQMQHVNVVDIYGFCSHRDDKLIVYEYVPHQSLDKFLFSTLPNCPRRAQLDWARRYAVMLGVARGLLYLHKDAPVPVIHRDIKTSNILIGDGWAPKIGDFGLARLFPEELTHTYTNVAGTNGYMAPEYWMYGQLSAKVDVYSFGVIVLELLTGRRNFSIMPSDSNASGSVLIQVQKHFNNGQIWETLDPVLNSTAELEQVRVCADLGLRCTHSDPAQRPDMQQVVILLSKHSKATPRLTYSNSTSLASSSTCSSSPSITTLRPSTAVRSRRSPAQKGPQHEKRRSSGIW